MFPLNSPPDLRAEYQARLAACLRNRPRVTGPNTVPRLPAQVRVLAGRIARWLRRAKHPQPVESLH
jgi:hypothetical protein